MEEERYEEVPQNLSESKAKTIPSDVKLECASSHVSLQSEAIDSKCLANAFTPTPEKTSHPPRNRNKRTDISAITVKLFSNEDLNEDSASEDELDELGDPIIGSDDVKISNAVTDVDEVEIPAKYMPLAELFDRVDTSIRLLSMRKKLPTFQNICTVMKALTQRILSYSDLAQIKYLLPEAINIEKILIHDEKSLCMVPVMKITFLLDVIGSDSNQSAFITLRQVFHQRLLDFFNDHPESSEIPLAMLPEPFNQRKHTDLPRHNFELPATESAPNSANAASPAALLSSSQCYTSESPLVKLSMLPYPLIVETPVQPTPAKRFSELSSCEKIDSESRALSHSAAKRSLIFEESKQFNDCSLETAVTKSIHADDDVTAAPSFSLEAEENGNHSRGQTGPVNRKQASASSTDFMNTIETIFRSANAPLITKQELLQKIISIDMDILDIGEAEEQLKLLEEAVPDWIFQKVVPSGDLLYGIKKITDLESARSRLSTAA